MPEKDPNDGTPISLNLDQDLSKFLTALHRVSSKAVVQYEQWSKIDKIILESVTSEDAIGKVTEVLDKSTDIVTTKSVILMAIEEAKSPYVFQSPDKIGYSNDQIGTCNILVAKLLVLAYSFAAMKAAVTSH